MKGQELIIDQELANWLGPENTGQTKEVSGGAIPPTSASESAALRKEDNMPL